MGKRKHDGRTLETKYKALVELEKGKTNKDVAKLFDIPANTLSTWKKNKEKIFEAFENQNSGQSKRLKENTYEQLNQAVLKWFTRIRGENVPAMPHGSSKGLTSQTQNNQVLINFSDRFSHFCLQKRYHY